MCRKLQMFTSLSLLILFINVVLMIADSLAHIRYSDCCTVYLGLTPMPINVTNTSYRTCIMTHALTLCGIDFMVTFWFTFEFCIRLWAAPSRFAFSKDLKNWGDLVSFLPFYIEVAVSASSSTPTHISGVFEVPKFLRLIKIIRIVRLVKLVRHSRQLQIMAMGIKASRDSFVLLMLLLLFFTFGFSATLYYIEGDEDDSFFQSIPAAAWWSIATYFAYGDSPPVTTGGKLVCSVGAVTGVIILAFPIGLILDSFTTAFREQAGQDKDAEEESLNPDESPT